MPLVSVIIPAYNAVATLPETYACLQKQTVGEFEIIFVDDVSTDNTAALIENLATRDARIKLIRQPANGGVSAARNAAIKEAKSEFLLFLDSDDLITHDHLARLLQVAGKHPDGDVYYCAYQRLFPNGDLSAPCFDPALAKKPLETLYKYSALAVHCVLVRRTKVIACGGFDATLRTSEDWDLWLRLALKGARFYGLNKSLAIYRTSHGSLSNRLSNMLPDAFKVLARAYADYPPASERFPLAVHQTLYAVWCMMNDYARGKNVDDMITPAYLAADLALYTKDFALYFVDGLRHGLAGTHQSLMDGFKKAQVLLNKTALVLASSSPILGLEKALKSAVEEELLRSHISHKLAILEFSSGISVDILSKINLPSLPQNIERLVINFTFLGKHRFTCVVPVYGVVTPDDVRRSIAPEQDDTATQDGILHLPLRLLRLTAKEFIAFFHPLVSSLYKKRKGAFSMLRAIRLGTLKRRILAALLSFSERAMSEASSQNNLIADKIKSILAELAAGSSASHLADGSATTSTSAPEYWENIFAQPDPWNYSSPYEELKYERTLAMLINCKPQNVLELACAEGHFTLKCAPLVKKVLATDISPTALKRAAERCKSFNNISYELLNFAKEDIPSGYDLIVASESLYYLNNTSELRQFASRLAHATGARILTAHAFVLADHPEKAGYDWDVPYGAAAIEEAFLATGLLELEQSFKTEAYSINLFRKKSCASIAAIPSEKFLVAVEPEPPPSFIRPNGRVPMSLLMKREGTISIPVLMYHRVSDAPLPALSRYNVTKNSFDEQMRYLQHMGYYPIDTSYLSDCITRGYAILGRPVLITFDDGYADFYENAANILEQYGFFAEVFLPLDKIGTSSDWDSHYGPPAPLMSWEQIMELSHKGTRFGSHLASHTPAPVLDNAQLIDEALRSRLMLEARLGKSITSIALPYGAADERIHSILKACGYSLGFKADGARASGYETRFALPRIEITGDDNLASFATKLGHTAETGA